MAGAKAKTGPASAGLRLLAVATIFTPAPAYAGAWITTSKLQHIASSIVGVRDGADYYEASDYFEAPLSADLSLVATPWMEQSYTDEDGWRAEATFGLKHSILKTESGAMAVQAAALWNSDPPAGCSEGGAELRWLGGVNLGHHGAFVNVEAAARELQGGCSENRLELTGGYHPLHNWLGLAQVFADFPDGGEDCIKAELSLVRFGKDGGGLQLGVRARIDGADAEPAIVLGFWGRPGHL